FDRFTVEQLAGDLLPNATVEQKVASGFNRNHMINFEGGAIPAEYLNNYIVDRVNTTTTVWLGLTAACAQCHDHKYDPISQREYYQLYAFFNNVPESGLDGAKGNAAPVLKVPSLAQKQKLTELEAALRDVDRELLAPRPEIDAAQVAWERTVLTERPPTWQTLDIADMKSRGGATLKKQSDGSILATGPNPNSETYTVFATPSLDGVTAIRLEVLPDDTLTARGPGRSQNGNLVLTNVRLSAGAKDLPVKFKSASADFSQKDYPVSAAIDADPKSGWGIYPEVGKPHHAVFELERPLAAKGTAVKVVLDFQSQFTQHQAGRFRL